MKYLFILFVLVLFSCTKSGSSGAKRDYICDVHATYFYHSSDTAYYHAHGNYRLVTTNVSDTLHSYDTTAIINYINSKNIYNPSYSTIGDTIVVLDQGADCLRYIH
jgi:hypothetical protein